MKISEAAAVIMYREDAMKLMQIRSAMLEIMRDVDICEYQMRCA